MSLRDLSHDVLNHVHGVALELLRGLALQGLRQELDDGLPLTGVGADKSTDTSQHIDLELIAHLGQVLVDLGQQFLYVLLLADLQQD